MIRLLQDGIQYTYVYIFLSRPKRNLRLLHCSCSCRLLKVNLHNTIDARSTSSKRRCRASLKMTRLTRWWFQSSSVLALNFTPRLGRHSNLLPVLFLNILETTSQMKMPCPMAVVFLLARLKHRQSPRRQRLSVYEDKPKLISPRQRQTLTSYEGKVQTLCLALHFHLQQFFEFDESSSNAHVMFATNFSRLVSILYDGVAPCIILYYSFFWTSCNIIVHPFKEAEAVRVILVAQCQKMW